MSRHLVAIVDESGSMSGIANDVIKGMNDFVAEQKKIEPEKNHEIMYTMIKFNDIVKTVFHRPLAEVPRLTVEDYQPNSMTALYDAIGMTISKMTDEHNVVMVVITDGMENSSQKYDRKSAMALIKRMREENNWKFVYLSTDPDTWEQGNQMGLHKTCQVVRNATTGRYNVTSGSQQNCVIGKSKLGSFLSSSYNNQVISDFRTSCVASSNPTSSVKSKFQEQRSVPGGTVNLMQARANPKVNKIKPSHLNSMLSGYPSTTSFYSSVKFTK